MRYDFFFQAEDGIRDLTVTGVQTCALPLALPTRISSVLGVPRSDSGWLCNQAAMSAISVALNVSFGIPRPGIPFWTTGAIDRKSTRLNSSHSQISYAVFCLKKKKKNRRS